MKTFEKFLAESSKPIKQLGDNTGKIDTKKTPGNILDIEQKKFVQNEKGKKKVLRNLEPQNQVKKNVIPSSKPPVTRYDPREPFMDDDLGQRTGKTGDRVVNKPVTQTSKVILGPDGKPLAYKGKNVPVVEPKKGETLIKGIKDADLEQKALDQTRKDLLKPKTLDTKPVTTTTTTTTKPKVTTGNKINFVEPKPIQKGIPGIKGDEPAIKPKRRSTRTKVTSYTTTPKSPTDFQGFAKRGLERTGLKSIKPKEKVGTKVKNIAKSKVTKNIIKKTPKRLVFNRALSGLGRVAGGAFAVKDFMDTARKEKALGRSKTAARLRGASKAIGGYVGGGIGALAGGLAGGGVASAGLGIAGGIAGYQAGSKIGDQIYKTGRNIVTGKKTFKNLRKDINKGASNLVKGTKNFFDTSGNP